MRHKLEYNGGFQTSRRSYSHQNTVGVALISQSLSYNPVLIFLPKSSTYILLVLVLGIPPFCWFHRSSFKGFSIAFLFSDWLKSNHLRSHIKRGFSDIFSRHICSTVTKTIRVTSYAASFGAKKCSENQVRNC